MLPISTVSALLSPDRPGMMGFSPHLRSVSKGGVALVLLPRLGFCTMGHSRLFFWATYGATNMPDTTPLTAYQAVAAMAALGGATIGAIVGGIINFSIGYWQAKWTRTMEFHREFNNEPLASSRSKAYACVLKYWGHNYEWLSEKEVESSGEDNQIVHVWAVMRFYQRLALALRHGLLKTSVVSALFGEIFIWWYEVSYRENLPKSWDAAEEIEFLHSQISRLAQPLSTGNRKLQRWRSVGVAERNRRNQQFAQAAIGGSQTSPAAPSGPPTTNCNLLFAGRALRGFHDRYDRRCQEPDAGGCLRPDRWV